MIDWLGCGCIPDFLCTNDVMYDKIQEDEHLSSFCREKTNFQTGQFSDWIVLYTKLEVS